MPVLKVTGPTGDLIAVVFSYVCPVFAKFRGDYAGFAQIDFEKRLRRAGDVVAGCGATRTRSRARATSPLIRQPPKCGRLRRPDLEAVAPGRRVRSLRLCAPRSEQQLGTSISRGPAALDRPDGQLDRLTLPSHIGASGVGPGLGEMSSTTRLSTARRALGSGTATT